MIEFVASGASTEIICLPWSNHSKIKETQIEIANGLDVHAISVVVTTEIIVNMISVARHLDETQPTIDGFDCAVKDAKRIGQSGDK
jgi:hypothetical protein